jgi:WD40 repeat protein
VGIPILNIREQNADDLFERDLRHPSKPVTTYVEAHSDDITSLCFHPSVPFALLSASIDSLVAVSDIRKTDEDDSVLGVINTGASVARAGWGGSSTIRSKVKAEDDAEGIALDIPDLGAFWSVSDMQTVGIWDADAWEEYIPPIDVRAGEAVVASTWKTEFVVDASADSQLIRERDSVGLFCGNQDGSTALIQIPNQADQDWIMHCLLTGGHTEPVRSVLWDTKNACVFTGAEDGLICGWQLSGDSQDPLDTLISLPPAQHKSPGAVKEERSRSSYRPY